MSLDASVWTRRQSFVLDVTLHAESGQAIAIVGRNGAGKSTLLRALAGIQGSSGRVVIDGQDVTARPPHQRSVGWVPQDGALFPHLSALDNVVFGCVGPDRREQAMGWLTELGIAALADRRPTQLSGGQAQKVALARALARRPRLLLLDEPLGALDPAARADLRDVLGSHLAGFDGVLLLVTHDEEDALSLCRRHVRLDAGRVVSDDAA